MSMVCETIMARALGMEVLGLTLVTNKAGRADNNHALRVLRPRTPQPRRPRRTSRWVADPSRLAQSA